MDVRMPDGTIIKNVPEGTTQEDLAARLAAYRSPESVTPKPEVATQEKPPFPDLMGGMSPHVLMGARQVWDAAAQMAARAGETPLNKISDGLGTRMREDTERINKEAITAHNAKYGEGTMPSIARGIGQALVTAPITPAIRVAGMLKNAAAGAGIGAGAAALTPVYDVPEGGFLKEKTKQAGIGAATGGALGGLGGAIGSLKPTESAKSLLDSGVRVPPGRAAGGWAGRAEEGIESVPIIGDMIRDKHLQAVTDFNRATINNEVLAPIGQKLSKGAIGHSAVKEARIKISNAYESVLDKIKIVPLDDTFRQEGNKIAGMSAELGESAQKQFMAILKNRLFDKVTPAGTMSATTMKEMDSVLGKLSAKFRNSPMPDQRQLGIAILEVQSSLRRNVERAAGPELAGELQAANAAWKAWIRVADASTRAGSKEGVFSAEALRSAAQKGDKVGFREGDAPMQEWAEAAEKVLGRKVPDSGTPFRLMGAAGLGGLLFDPAIAATGAGIAAAYSNPGQKALTALLRNSGKAESIVPYLGLLSGPVTSQFQ